MQSEGAMQTNEQEAQIQPVSADPKSQPFPPVSPVQGMENDDDPEIIFMNAVAEIDTQPLPKRKAVWRWQDLFQTIVCVSLIGISCFGIVWQAIAYPHTLILLYAREKPSHITVSLPIPTRSLAPVTVTRSQTALTTGHGHQIARAATGILTFYNGQSTPQSIAIGTVFIGTVFTGIDGVKVATTQTVIVPAANLPQVGEATVSAHAILPGSQGNIQAFDINVALSSVLKMRNEAPFTNGREAREYKAVAPQDIQILTETVNEELMQAVTTAFPIQQGETAIPIHCHNTTIPNHQVGDEAQSVTLTASKTCAAVAYSQATLSKQATAAFTQTKPAANYHLVGSVQTALQSVLPVTVTISGKWVYTFSPEYEQSLAQKIAGDTPAQARKVLLRTEVISYASIPDTLPPAVYIDFLVLA
jgi:hypothetical protein